MKSRKCKCGKGGDCFYSEVKLAKGKNELKMIKEMIYAAQKNRCARNQEGEGKGEWILKCGWLTRVWRRNGGKHAWCKWVMKGFCVTASVMMFMMCNSSFKLAYHSMFLKRFCDFWKSLQHGMRASSFLQSNLVPILHLKRRESIIEAKNEYEWGKAKIIKCICIPCLWAGGIIDYCRKWLQKSNFDVKCKKTKTCIRIIFRKWMKCPFAIFIILQFVCIFHS